MDVIVVGAGLVGLSTAYHLADRGVRVTIVEVGRNVGGGASRGNAAWVCPTQVAPLAAPGLVRRLTREALSATSALYVRPKGLPGLTPFLVRLAAGATERTYRERVEALRPLATRAWPSLEAAVADGIEVPLRQSGILSVFSDQTTAQHTLDLLGAGPGVPTQLLSRDDCREDCLSDRVAMGYVLPADGYVDPSALVEALAAAVRARGGRILFEREIQSLARDEACWTIGSGTNQLRAEAVVLAAGARTPALAAMAGHRVRVVPGKGYSFTAPMVSPPSRPLHLEEAYVVVTPLETGVRVAGTMEFGDTTNHLDPRRIEVIAAAAAPWVTGVDWSRKTDQWVGERPITSDGLPAIGSLEEGLFVATGHGMFGLTLALPTGEVLAREILGEAPLVDLAPLAPTRPAIAGRVRRYHGPR